MSEANGIARIGNLLGALALAVNDRVFGDLANVGFTESEAAVLVTLLSNPGLRIRDIADIVKHSHPGTVRLVGRLESRGLLQKRQGEDRREARLSLTPRGHRAVETIHAERRARLVGSIEILPEERRIELRQILELLLSKMPTDDLNTFQICRLCEESECDDGICPVESRYRGQWP